MNCLKRGTCSYLDNIVSLLFLLHLWQTMNNFNNSFTVASAGDRSVSYTHLTLPTIYSV